MSEQARITLTGVAEKAVASATTGDLEIEGWLARYGVPDRQQELFLPGAFANAVEAVKNGRVPILYQHEDGKQLGQIVELEEKAEGVWMRGIVPKPTAEWAVDVYEKLKRGMVTGLSSKGMFTKKLLPGGGAMIADVDLFEGSVTPVAVEPGATIEMVAQKAFPDLGIEDAFGVVSEYFESKLAEVERKLAEVESQLQAAG
jgi:HK97 family phage prohead protease